MLSMLRRAIIFVFYGELRENILICVYVYGIYIYRYLFIYVYILFII